ncbi:hypothetical protein PLICRDRAFT_221659 [Plicaturopsis crispa FD-325 SS-3]|nr:hypothetical protein PLICRDRAFT_221659 [Plicaturopsis crispa FD-325 SS-3]
MRQFKFSLHCSFLLFLATAFCGINGFVFLHIPREFLLPSWFYHRLMGPQQRIVMPYGYNPSHLLSEHCHSSLLRTPAYQI